MRVLGIDTTKKVAKVLIVDTNNSSQNYMVQLGENVKHSEGLFLYIEKAMLENNLNIFDIDAFACVVGPGSFTGIRVGMATIKGFNKVLQKSIISMNTFDVLLSSVKNGIILLNSTLTSCYYARVKKSEIIETGVVDKLKIYEFAQGETVFVLQEEQNILNLEYSNIKIIDLDCDLYAKCIASKLDTMQYGEFLPYYLQLSQAERNCKNE